MGRGRNEEGIQAMEQARIRNFCIIAHVDHGKSTLADRLLELTGTLSEREMREQVLDTLELEREKGITIKAQAVRMFYTARDGVEYELNLIDTPGHVDFTYEVSRALAAAEGALLVVDATQGIEAQTLTTLYQALEHDLEILPVVNKIDLPSAEPERVAEEIERVIGIPAEEVFFVSAKEGTGVPELLEAIVERVPPPKGDPDAPLRALIFDSQYDPYKGVVAYVRVFDGRLRADDVIRLMATEVESEVMELGTFRPWRVPVEELTAGEVGYVATGLKDVRQCRVGDTITLARRPAEAPLPGYRAAKPMVFAGLYTVNSEEAPLLRDALEKLQLNDAALSFVPEHSAALGFGFRCGFLGLLHMEIVRERLEREFGLELIFTAPNVEYQVRLKDGEVRTVSNPAEMPDPSEIEEIAEPWMKVTLITPPKYIGPLIDLVTGRRGEYKGMEYIDEGRVILTFEVPLSEILVDFYDQVKSLSQGYASMDYEWIGYRAGDLVKLDILLQGQPVDALSVIVHRESAYRYGRRLLQRLRKRIPRQLFEVVLQAAIGRKIIARESIAPLRKDVLAKCYGGDVTRKKKLLEKQKEGKKRMKKIGRVEVPQEAFLAVLRLNEE